MGAHPPRSHFGLSLVLFGLSVVAAFLLLVTAFTEWLATCLHSSALASLVCGGFFIIVAVVVYFCALHESLQQFRSQMETVYEVAETLRNAYRRMMRTVAAILRLF